MSKHVKENALIIDEHTEIIEKKEIQINALKGDKVDQDTYDADIFELREAIAALGSGK